jgi:integrase
VVAAGAQSRDRWRVNVQADDTAPSRRRKLPPGIRARHTRTCATAQGRRCSCVPSYEAYVALGKSGERRRKTFATLRQATDWRTRMLAAKTRRRLRAPASVTLREAAEAFLDGIKSGAIANRSGDTYKPSVVRSYDQALHLHVLPDLGGRRLGDVTTSDLQDLVERLRRKELSASTIANAMNPVQAIYRRATQLGHVMHNPCRDVSLPTIRGKRDHAAEPGDAARMILALPEQDQCVWALAFYAGLRLGELRALRWDDINEKDGLIDVQRSWDAREGEIDPKSFAGTRSVPIIAALRPYLAAQRARCAWQPAGLMLGKAERTPFSYNGLYRRSEKASMAAKLPRVTPHQARHSFASYLIAAGADVKAVTEIMGHASVRQSFDRYGHLLRDSHANTVTKLDALLLAADTQHRVAQLAP